jgi:transposase-like protein
VVRHGHLPEREIMTGIGPVAIRQPRVRDREAPEGECIWDSPSIVPPDARRSKSLEVLIPVLYLKGISTGDFEEALAALVGKSRPLRRQGTRPVYRRRPSLASRACPAQVGGALGFWKALGEVWPTTREQRCWVHKTANILNKMPKSLHTKAKRSLQEIWMAETKKDAVAALEAPVRARGRLVVETYQVKYKRAADCLTKDRDALLACYNCPAEHWKRLRTTNPIESTFATVRHRTIRSKGCLSNKTALAMVFKLADGAQKSWRRIDGHISCQN